MLCCRAPVILSCLSIAVVFVCHLVYVSVLLILGSALLANKCLMSVCIAGYSMFNLNQI